MVRRTGKRARSLRRDLRFQNSEIKKTVEGKVNGLKYKGTKEKVSG